MVRHSHRGPGLQVGRLGECSHQTGPRTPMTDQHYVIVGTAGDDARPPVPPWPGGRFPAAVRCRVWFSTGSPHQQLNVSSSNVSAPRRSTQPDNELDRRRVSARADALAFGSEELNHRAAVGSTPLARSASPAGAAGCSSHSAAGSAGSAAPSVPNQMQHGHPASPFCRVMEDAITVGSRETTVGWRSGGGRTDDQLTDGYERVEQQPAERDGGQHRVQAVHDATVSREQLPHVLQAQVTLDQRLEQIPRRRAHHRHGT